MSKLGDWKDIAIVADSCNVITAAQYPSISHPRVLEKLLW
jgi:hypothetical protein